jgi:hypothetical protein
MSWMLVIFCLPPSLKKKINKINMSDGQTSKSFIFSKQGTKTYDVKNYY